MDRKLNVRVSVKNCSPGAFREKTIIYSCNELVQQSSKQFGKLALQYSEFRNILIENIHDKQS